MNLDYEKKLLNRGFQNICGIDEAGRGALAGPLVAAAVIFDIEKMDFFEDINDSKLLPEKKRLALQPLIMRKAKSWAVGVVTHQEIDKYGLGFANKIAMKRAWKHLAIRPDYILSDYLAKTYFETPFELIIKGDKKILSIAAASILAKVFRDNMMLAFARKYPEFCFEIHKGYGTALHNEKLKKIGPCEIHRKTFGPLKAKLFG